MRKVSHVLLAVTIAAVGMTLTGCPEKSGLVGSWILQLPPETSDGVTLTMQQIYKFFDDGQAAVVSGFVFSGNGWSAEMRLWVIGTYSAADGTLTISLTGTQCDAVAAKLIVTGAIPEEFAQEVNDMFADMVADLDTPPDDVQSIPYTVDGDTLILTIIAFSRFDDNFDYANPNATGCTNATS
ncbi:MAG: hypothetical protein NTZ09_15580 [Candidatus Hydrogenedentes bacterium]|nr:hypothetical protein [Candidatus Hydrogenedentota bacterium]